MNSLTSRSLGAPLLRLLQLCADQEEVGGLAGLRPLAGGVTSPLQPEAEAPVLVGPVAQLGPVTVSASWATSAFSLPSRSRPRTTRRARVGEPLQYVPLRRVEFVSLRDAPRVDTILT
jgi:hypothetical protein